MTEHSASENQEVQQDAADDVWAAAMAEQQTASSPDNNHEAQGETDGYPRADFEALEADGGSDTVGDANLEMILDIPVTIALEIGRSKISIRNLLKLNQGSVVELDRLAGEPLDVLVNGTLIAHGEVVMVNEKFGIRLTDVISPAERVRNLK